MIQIIDKPIVLVDGSFYFYRAYYALSSLISDTGEPIGAIYGVLNMLKSLIIQYRPSHMAIIFDTNGKTFRNKLFKNYKNHRLPMSFDLRCQIIPLFNIIKAMGIPLLYISGFEADDIIGTIAQNTVKDGYNILISTGDKDMAQLVSSKINIINSIPKTVLYPKTVQLKFGVPPELIIDYIALIGDKSDNIPGIPGIGKKIAQILLHKIGGLKILYQQLDKISMLDFRGAKNIADKLNKYREIAFLSYQLATIKTDVPLSLSYNFLKLKNPKTKELMMLFHKYGLKTWLSKFTSV